MAGEMTNRLFAKRASLLAASVSRWAAEALDDDPNQPVPDEILARFIGEVSRITDLMWLEPVTWSPATPEPGGLGSNMTCARVSKLHPGEYIGECYACGAKMIAAKRTLYCDDCEHRRRAAIAERRTALATTQGRETGGGVDG